MRDHGFLPAAGGHRGRRARRQGPPRHPALVTVASHERVKEAIDRLHAYSVSQLPVVHGGDPADLSSVVGSVQEGTLLERLFRKPEVLDAQVVDVMDPPSPPSSSTSRPRPPSSSSPRAAPPPSWSPTTAAPSAS
jgi:cystathionine beta-synthase